MKLLADVNIEEAMIRWLISQKYDLILARDEYNKTPDIQLLEIAISQKRIILTRDKYFGDLIFRDFRKTEGVILIRLHAGNQLDRLEVFKAYWSTIEKSVLGSLVVVTNDRLRIKTII